jgi:hypothetical protein
LVREVPREVGYEDDAQVRRVLQDSAPIQGLVDAALAVGDLDVRRQIQIIEDNERHVFRSLFDCAFNVVS